MRSGHRDVAGTVDARLDGFAHRLGLLVDLLEHVMRKTILVRLGFLIVHEFSILPNAHATQAATWPSSAGKMQEMDWKTIAL